MYRRPPRIVRPPAPVEPVYFEWAPFHGADLGKPEWDYLRRFLDQRAGGRCEVCGKRFGPDLEMTCHHRRPRGMGGTTDPAIHGLANLVATCGDGTTGCHGWLESQRALARTVSGLLVDHGSYVGHGEPPEVSRPLTLRWSGRRVLLHPTAPSYLEPPGGYWAA